MTGHDYQLLSVCLKLLRNIFEMVFKIPVYIQYGNIKCRISGL